MLVYLLVQGYLWVLGGRAREFMDLPEERSIGGIIGPRVEDINASAGNPLQRFSTQREASVVKSDVWRSLDGSKWELVTPGCRAPQENFEPQGFPGQGKFGIKEYACTKDSDCYGAETCDLVKLTCKWRRGFCFSIFNHYPV
jgi:hypothetical protein